MGGTVVPRSLKLSKFNLADKIPASIEPLCATLFAPNWIKIVLEHESKRLIMTAGGNFSSQENPKITRISFERFVFP